AILAGEQCCRRRTGWPASNNNNVVRSFLFHSFFEESRAVSNVAPSLAGTERETRSILQARSGAVKQRARSVASLRIGSAIRLCAGIRSRNPDRVFSMMIDEELSVGRWQTPHSFSLPNRLMPRFGVRRRIFDDESHHTIDLGERFLHRRFSGYLDHPLTADLFRPFLKRFVLITIGATAEFLA